jgi:uncharacterized protein YebE (UPF0316 family)
MESVLNGELWLYAGVIFILRVGDMSLDTLRVLYVMRGQKGIAWILGFFQAIIFITAITTVLSNLDNLIYIIAYAAGFATGNVVGMIIEERLAQGYSHLRIISSSRGNAIAESLRNEGYAATEISGRGKDGTVTSINCSVKRNKIHQVRKLVEDMDIDAFITAEDIRPIHRGFWRA